MRLMLRLFYCIFILAVLSLQSCAEETPRLRPSDLVLIDSLFKKETKLIKIEYDSICELNYQKNLDVAVDSILTLRLEERKKKLGF